jgi:hypothetical protein
MTKKGAHYPSWTWIQQAENTGIFTMEGGWQALTHLDLMSRQ